MEENETKKKNEMKLKLILILLFIVLAGAIGYKIFYSKSNADSGGKTPKKSSSLTIAGNHPFGFTGISDEEAIVAKEVGDTIVRGSVSWNQIEPKQGQYNFDKYAGNRENSDFTRFVRIRTGNIWATKCDLSLCKNKNNCPRDLVDCPPKDLGSWTDKGYSPLLYDLVYKTLEFAKTKNYPDRKLIVGNEVNTPQFWLGTIEDYVKTRSTIFKAVQDINKKYQTRHEVVDNGFASAVWAYAMTREAYCDGKVDNAKDFAQRFFIRQASTATIEKQLAKPTDCNQKYESQIQIDTAFAVDQNLKVPTFDYMSYHFYEPWDTQEEVINWIKDKMKKNGYERPILNTEGGFADQNRLSYDKNPELKSDVANDIPKIHVVAFANGVQSFLWLPLIENYTGETFGPEWKGLELPDGSKLPAYYSYKTMISKLDGFKSIEKIKGLSTKYAYKFTFENKGPVYVIWSTKDTNINFSPILKGEIKMTKVDGSTQKTQSTNILVGTSPVYLEK